MYHPSVRNSSCLSKLQLSTVHPAGSCHHNIHCQVFTYHRMKLSAERLPPLLLFTPQVSIIPFCSVILDAHMYTLKPPPPHTHSCILYGHTGVSWLVWEVACCPVPPPDGQGPPTSVTCPYGRRPRWARPSSSCRPGSPGSSALGRLHWK